MAPAVLGFDTSAAHCAAALLCGDRILAVRAEDMTRGQAERLFPMIEELLEDAGLLWRDLSALGVGTGPGNFTGIRIAVSAARGLALGLGIPAIGVTGCEARARLGTAETLNAVPAPRDQVYLCDPSDPTSPPRLMMRSAARDAARRMEARLETGADPADLAVAIARIAAERRSAPTAAPAPVYVRPADAAPSRDLPPVLLE